MPVDAKADIARAAGEKKIGRMIGARLRQLDAYVRAVATMVEKQAGALVARELLLNAAAEMAELVQHEKQIAKLKGKDD